MVKGYKVFNADWTCSPDGNTKQYTCPGKFEEDITPIRCGKGMHFCKKAADCFNYYSFNPDNKVAEVIAYGDIAEEGDKCCTNKLEVVRAIPWQEVLEIVNTGDQNTGNRNTGNQNTGDWNTGNWNTGNQNTGDQNTGDWNTTNFSSGCFNTIDQTIFLFDRPSEWTYSDWLKSDACHILNGLQENAVEWVSDSEMTDKEMVANPTYETTGGYLKALKKPGRAQAWWDDLSEDDRDIIRRIPNFNPKIFSQCTGIETKEVANE